MKFFNRNKKRIANLEYKIMLMKWEIAEERKLYDDKMKKMALNQKVQWVLGNGTIELQPGKTIKRPLYAITEDEAHEVTNAVYDTLKSMGIVADVWSSYNDIRECYVIGIKIDKLSTII